MSRPGEPVVGEPHGHGPVGLPDPGGQLQVVRFLVPDGSQKVADAFAVVSPAHPQVFGDHSVQAVVPVADSSHTFRDCRVV